jgi:aspartyl-tRNA(Asn)/glutamyl-tRNA(Gln) amidotransferase subunit A
MSGLNWKTAADLAQGYAAGDFSPPEVLADCLAQAERLEPALNALVPVDPAAAWGQAEASAARWRAGAALGPLDGVPVLVKDLLLTSGQPTLRGSWTVDAAGPWNDDAPAVARLREAGAVLMARTTTPEIGWKGVTDSLRHGVTRNPWDVSKTPGGSSGGASAAVAAGYAPLALGTDGGGSIRIPASFAGIFGLKPSFGRVPAWPLSPFGTVAHVGPMTRTVQDAALLLDVIARPDNRDWHALPHDPASAATGLRDGIRGLRVAYSPALGFASVEPEVATAVRRGVDLMADLGAEITEIDPGFDDPAETFRTLWWAGARAALGHLPPEDHARMDAGLVTALQDAARITLDQYLAATKARGALGAQMRRFMDGFDVLVTPTMPIAAFAAGELSPYPVGPRAWLDWTPFSYPFNLTQQPASSLNCGFTPAGLPIGLQIVGRMFEDRTVLRASAAVESALGLWGLRPPLAA